MIKYKENEGDRAFINKDLKNTLKEVEDIVYGRLGYTPK